MSAGPPPSPPPYPGSLTDIAGLEVGHFADSRRPTGCTVVLARSGAVAGVDVRGAAPGTRETDLLAPENLIQEVHGVLLSGGSAWGLDAAAGVMRWLEEQGCGIDTGHGRVPIVPAAVIFDLPLGDGRIRPDAHAGYQACRAATDGPVAQGNVGAGMGATVGKLAGLSQAMKGGLGTASVSARGHTVAALVVCNAAGDVLDPLSGKLLAGARSADGVSLLNSRTALLGGQRLKSMLAGTHTTIGVIATDAPINKSQARRLAMAGHDGLARSINPVHTSLDGDTLFALGTGRQDAPPDMMSLCALAAEATTRAVVNAVWQADALEVAGLRFPCARKVI